VAEPGARILDIGAGAGKFCIVAAAVCDAKVTGIEHREHLVTIAKRAAAAFGVDVSFEHGSFETCDPHRFDGFYLYNPFAENFAGPGERIDGSIELNARAFVRFSTLAEEFLERARVGARVVTYYGFGGTMPLPYQRVTHAYGGRVELWVKTRSKLA
jgi:SAM-dependent methyltransferase